mmetsp:Transcript_121332/g.223317  ORF Transcript_121332/g.223317 Transcript_121332/m.223317 type:complete len:416 (+) Transcript_121332:95-1342(+)
MRVVAFALASVAAGVAIGSHARRVHAMPTHAELDAIGGIQEPPLEAGVNPMSTLAMLFQMLNLQAAFKPSLRSPPSVRALHPGASQRTGLVAAMELPNDRKTMISALTEAVQASLSSRQSRIAVEFPLGFSFGVLGEAVDKAKKKEEYKVIKAEDVRRSNRELGRLFVGMFEGTELKPLVLFPSEPELVEAKKLWWDVLAADATVNALVPTATKKEATAEKEKAMIAEKGGFGGGGGFSAGGGKKGKGKSKKKSGVSSGPMRSIPDSVEVVIAIAPDEEQLRVLKAFSEKSGMDKLVIILNARLDAQGGAEGLAKPQELVEYFRDGGEGGFTTTFLFSTQPFGVAKAGSPEAKTQKDDPVVLYRKYPEDWIFAKKPILGAPKILLKREASEGRPSKDELREVLDNTKEGLLGNLF